MKGRDAMAADVEALSADDSIVSAARLMGRAGTGFLPVLAAGHPVGVQPARAIVVRFVAGGGADPPAPGGGAPPPAGAPPRRRRRSPR